MRDELDSPEARDLEEVIARGTEYASTALSVPLGTLAAGPLGAVAGVAVGHVLGDVGLALYRHYFSRQQRRVATAIALIARDLRQDGDSRSDRFFEAVDARGASPAGELVEHVLLAAADAYEELKLPHIAAIVSSVSRRSDLSIAEAHWITTEVQAMSWRQLTLLALFDWAPIPELERLHDPNADAPDISGIPAVLVEEIEDLGRRRLLGTLDAAGRVVRSGGTIGSLEGGLLGIPRHRWRPTDAGRLIIEIAQLDAIEDAVRQAVLKDLLG